MRYKDVDAWASAAGMTPVGNEVRLSQILADEVWDKEREYEPPDAAPSESYKDIVKHAAKILEAEKEERLETEAILNAKPFAEFVRVAEGDKGSKALKATNRTLDDDGLAILEMVLPDNRPAKQSVKVVTTASASMVEAMLAKEELLKIVTTATPIISNVTTSQHYLGETTGEIIITSTSATISTSDMQIAEGGYGAEDDSTAISSQVDSGVLEDDATVLPDIDVSTSDGGPINQKPPTSNHDPVPNSESTATSQPAEEANGKVGKDNDKRDSFTQE